MSEIGKKTRYFVQRQEHGEGWGYIEYGSIMNSSPRPFDNRVAARSEIRKLRAAREAWRKSGSELPQYRIIKKTTMTEVVV